MCVDCILIMQRRLLPAHLAHVTWSLPGGQEKSGTCLQCVWQRSIWLIETQMVFQSNHMDFISWYNPSQAFTAKHVSYPRLTATLIMGWTLWKNCIPFETKKNKENNRIKNYTLKIPLVMKDAFNFSPKICMQKMINFLEYSLFMWNFVECNNLN